MVPPGSLYLRKGEQSVVYLPSHNGLEAREKWTFDTLGLSSISSRVSDGVIKPVSISGGRIDKSVAVLFYIHPLKQHTFDISLLGYLR